jgi:O-antigen/teichoic acid export membrane protein
MGDTLDDFAAISMRGSITLLIGDAVALIINAVGVILVARILSPADYGLYSVSLVLPGFFMLFSDWGINMALTRFIAQYRSQNRHYAIGVLVKSGVYFKFFLGCFLSLLLFIFAEYLSNSVLLRPEVVGFVKISSVLIVSQSIFNTVLSIFSGYERMEFRAIISVVQSLVKGFTSPLLVFIGYGVSGAVIGHTLSYVVSAVVALVLVGSLTRSDDDHTGSIQMSLKIMLRYGIPIFLGGITIGLAQQFRGFFLSWFITSELIGNFSVANWFIMLVTTFSTAIPSNLFPAFSKISILDEPKKAEEMFRGSVKYSTMVLLPFVFLMIVISEPLVLILFGDKYPQAVSFLSLRLLYFVFIGLGSYSIFPFMNSQGDTKASMRINVVTSALMIFLTFIFIQLWSVVGLIIAYTLSVLVKNLLGILILRKKYGISPNLQHSGKTFISCVLSGSLVFVFNHFFSTVPLLDLLLSAVVFLSAYLVLAPILGAIRIWDLKYIDSMSKNIRVYPVIRIILNILEKVIQATSRAL